MALIAQESPPRNRNYARGMRLGFGGHVLDVGRRELRFNDEIVEVQPQVFAVLVVLAENRHRVVEKNELLDEVWGDRFVSESALATRIKEVRRAVGDNGVDQSIIKTIHGVGYRFVVDAIDLQAVEATVPPPVSAPPVVGEFKVPRTNYADRSGASIAFQTFGSGPDVLLINGFTTNVELLWEHPNIAGFLHALSSFARVTIFDNRGVGCSERLAQEEIPSLEVRSDDLLAVMNDAGIERATIFGSSEGGSLAVVFTATHPDRVERLIVHGAWVTGGAAMGQHAKLVEEHWGKGWIYGALGPSLAATKEGRRFLSRYERQSGTPRIALSIIDLLGKIDLANVLPTIRTPTLILHSRDDAWVPYEQAERFHNGVAGSVLVPLEREDHYLFSGDYGPLMAAVQDFVADESAPPSSDPETRQLASILMVDIVDSTARAVEMGDADWTRLLDRFYRAATSTIGFSRGELINTTGDGLIAIFDGPGRAINAATALNSVVEPMGLQIRSGVHCAEIQRRGSDVAGVGVHIASRIASLAGPGEIWVSRTITDLVAGNSLGFEPRGDHELRGIDQAWTLFSVAA